MDAFNPFQPRPRSHKGVLIVAATRQIIAESGTDAVTRKRVAERAGLTPAEVSREYHSRAALMRVVASAEED